MLSSYKVKCGKDFKERNVFLSDSEAQTGLKRCISCKRYRAVALFVPIFAEANYHFFAHQYGDVYYLSKKCQDCWGIKSSHLKKALPNSIKCLKCAQIRPRSDFIVPSRKKKDGSNYMSSWCKECVRSYRSEYYRNRYKNDPEFCKVRLERAKAYKKEPK